jgi:hypothetical protein
MADIIIRPGLGVLQFTGSANTVAYITASDSLVEFSSSTKLQFTSTDQVSVSGSFVLSSSAADSFIIRMDDVTGSAEKFKINSQGITVLGSAGSTPTPVEGGIYYRQGVFYVGDNA